MKKAFLALCLLLLLAAPALAVGPQEILPDAAQEERARGITRALRCLVCQGQSVEDSEAPLAGDLRRLVREQVRAGHSDDEIREYVRARYGDRVLLDPPVVLRTLVLWITPTVALIAGLVAAAAFIRRQNGKDDAA